MSILPIIIAPDPRLKVKSNPVGVFNKELCILIDEMFETMYAAPGIGLAAIQIGVPKRLLVIDISRDNEPNEPRVFINPEILWTSQTLSTYQEGCLSVPEQYADVERPDRVVVRYCHRDGAVQEEEFDGLLATCLQHEMDHLEGILFVDYLSFARRSMILRKVAKAKRSVRSRA